MTATPEAEVIVSPSSVFAVAGEALAFGFSEALAEWQTAFERLTAALADLGTTPGEATQKQYLLAMTGHTRVRKRERKRRERLYRGIAKRWREDSRAAQRDAQRNGYLL